MGQKFFLLLSLGGRHIRLPGRLGRKRAIFADSSQVQEGEGTFTEMFLTSKLSRPYIQRSNFLTRMKMKEEAKSSFGPCIAPSPHHQRHRRCRRLPSLNIVMGTTSNLFELIFIKFSTTFGTIRMNNKDVG